MQNAIVLLSGGHHSAAALLLAMSKYHVSAAVHVAADSQGSNGYRAAKLQCEALGLPLDLATASTPSGRGIVPDLIKAGALVGARYGAHTLVLGLWHDSPGTREGLIEAQTRLRGQLDMPGLEVVVPLLGTSADLPFGIAAQHGKLAMLATATCSCDSSNARSHSPHPWGYGCADCDGCERRQMGWMAYEQAMGLLA